MKTVLISIQPKWCKLIANGQKTVEVRKTKPKLETPFKVYIYCTKSNRQFLQSRNNVLFYCENKDFIGGHGVGWYQRLNGKVIGEFVCRNIYFLDEISNSVIEEYSCLGIDELLAYKGDKEKIYGWSISDFVIYDKPKELREFFKVGHSEYCKLEWEQREKLRRKLNKYNENTGSKAHLNTDSDFANNLKMLSPFKIKRPPQSWCYVEGKEDDGNEV